MRTRFAALSLLVLLPVVTGAQHGGGGPAMRTAPAEAKQFDFLVGQWEITVVPRISGLAARIHGIPKLIGTWRAWRGLDGWGIEDEMRITDESGNPVGFAHAVRFYDANAHRWIAQTLDVVRGGFTPSTAEWKNGRMESMSKGTNGEGKVYAQRGRYTDITPTSFRFQQERSFDEGRTWDVTLTIEAKRVAASAAR